MIPRYGGFFRADPTWKFSQSGRTLTRMIGLCVVGVNFTFALLVMIVHKSLGGFSPPIGWSNTIRLLPRVRRQKMPRALFRAASISVSGGECSSSSASAIIPLFCVQIARRRGRQLWAVHLPGKIGSGLSETNGPITLLPDRWSISVIGAFGGFKQWWEFHILVVFVLLSTLFVPSYFVTAFSDPSYFVFVPHTFLYFPIKLHFLEIFCLKAILLDKFHWKGVNGGPDRGWRRKILKIRPSS